MNELFGQVFSIAKNIHPLKVAPFLNRLTRERMPSSIFLWLKIPISVPKSSRITSLSMF